MTVVDTSKPPGWDESAFLVALLTAVSRPSLHLAPGVLLRGAPISGAGTCKGLLARCICAIAFGREPRAATAGATAEELEKRIAAELIEASAALFLDNLNNMQLKSNLLASAMTERAGARAGARDVDNGAAEFIRFRGGDWQRSHRLGGSRPALSRGGFRCAHRASESTAVYYRYSGRGKRPSHGVIGRCANHLAVGPVRDRHRSGSLVWQLRNLVPVGARSAARARVSRSVERVREAKRCDASRQVVGF